MFPALPRTVIHSGRKALRNLSSCQKNRISSAVKGWPSDHFIPLRRKNVHSRWSGDTIQAFATFGRIGSPSGDQRTNPTHASRHEMMDTSLGLLASRIQVPP